MTILEAVILIVLGFISGTTNAACQETDSGAIRPLLETASDPDADAETRFSALIELVSKHRIHDLTPAFEDLKSGTDASLAAAAKWLQSCLYGVLPETDPARIEQLVEQLPAAVRDPARRVLLARTGLAAILNRELGLVESCATSLSEAAVITGDTRCEFEATFLRGMLALLGNDLATGRSWFDSARRIAEERNDPLGVARTRLELGRSSFLIGDLSSARHEYEAAIEVFLAHEALFDATQALRYLSQVIVTGGDPAGAADPCSRALALAMRYGWIGEELEARRLDGLLRIANDDLVGARSVLAEYAARAKDVESRSHEATAERDLAAIDYVEDRFEAARSRLESALAISESIGDLDGAAEAHMRLASIAGRVGDSLAMEFHAGAVIGQRPDSSLTGLDLHLLLQRAEARLQLGDHEAAGADLRRALSIAGDRGQLDRICDGLRLRAKLHADLGDHDSALADALESARVAAEIDDSTAVAGGHILAAQIRFDRGDDEGASADLDIAEPIVESGEGSFFSDPSYRVHIRLVRCGIAYRAGDLDDAEAHAAAARQLAADLGYADIERQADLLSATIGLRRARETDDDMARTHLVDAEAEARAALASADRAGAAPLRIGPLTLLVEILIARDDLEAANRHLDDALETIESIAGDEAAAAFGVEIASKARSGHAWLFALTQDLAKARVERAEAGGADPETVRALIESAFSEVTRFQGRALAEGIVELRRGLRSREGSVVRRRIAGLDEKVDRCLRESAEALRDGNTELSIARRGEADSLRLERDALAAELRRVEPRRTALLSPPPVSPEMLRAVGRVGAETSLVSYVTGTTRTFAYVVTGTDIHLLALADTQELEQRVAEFLAEIGVPESLGDVDAVERRGRALASLVLDPVLAVAGEGIRRLVVLPSAQLAHVPFEALVMRDRDGSGAPSSFLDVPFLLDRLDVRYAPSASVLLELSSSGERRRPGTAGVFADSAGGLGFPALRNAIVEGEKVAARFPEAERFFDDRAAQVALRGDLRRFAVLHFATHALAFAAPPLPPGLLLRGEDGEARIVPVGDVLDLELDADLVVLSACSTSAGEPRPGEGVESLARAFLFAGARAVVASLFPLSDAAALATVDDFYGRLIAARSDPAAALLATKRAIRRGEIAIPSPSPSRGVGAVRATPRGVPVGHPFHWAPLIVIGG